MSELPDRYWDACAFLGWLAEEPGRVDKCQLVLDAAEAGKLTIVTSTFTLVEVIRLKSKTPLPPDLQPKLENFFKQPYIVLREVTRRTGEMARLAVWEYGVEPKDAIHVATALQAELQYLDTFDDALIGKSGKIGNPPLIIGEPYVPGQGELGFGEEPDLGND